MQTQKKLGLVLGGGGSRGMAHIGVLEVLIREQIPIDLIVGTSMGAIVGTLFALGYSPADMIEQLAKWQRNNIFGVNVFSARARQRTIREQLGAAFKDRTFSDTQIPLVIMAVDMLAGREIALTSGTLLSAVLASSAVPAVFPPVEINGMKLVDGGVIDSLSTHAAFRHGADKVIAVDIYPPLEPDNWSDPLSAIMGFDIPLLSKNALSKSPSMVSAIWRSVRIMTCHLHAERLMAHPPDVLLRPDIASIGSLDFKDLNAPLEAGKIEAERHLPAIKMLVEIVTEQTGS
jgi:NTE family protein